MNRPRLFTVLSLLCVGALCPIGCGGEDSPATVGNGGASGGSGGVTGGSGGATGGSGGSTTGGAAGAAGAAGLECSHEVPPDERITDFEVWDGVNWGDDTSLTGDSFDYGAGDHEITLEVVDGVLNVTGTVPADGFAGFGLAFGPCTDASEYAGVTFTIGGDPGETQVVLQVQTSKNLPVDTSNNRGECQGDWGDPCANNEVEIEMPADLPGSVTVLWEDLSGGAPQTEVDPAELLGVQWEFRCEEEPCEFSITLDDVAFSQ